MNLHRLRHNIFTIALGLALSATAADRIIIIDGHFFNEVPVSADQITGMSAISTPNGSRAMVFTLSNPLPEEALKYAVSADSVAEAADLLRRAEDAKVRSIAVAANAESTIKVGDRFPEFSATDIDGHQWSNDDVAGRPMVLNLWFTGCGPCRAEMAELSQWKAEMPDVAFFSATYEDAATARPVIERQGFTWTALVNDKQFSRWIDGHGYPVTIVVDRNGVITHIERGTSPMQREQLKAKISAVR
jgi:peroxiredoxin